MTFKHDGIMLVLIIAKYRLLQQNSNMSLCINPIILAMLFCFALLKIHVASKNLEQTIYINKLLKENLKV